MNKYNFPEKIKDDNPNITKCNKSVKYHQAGKGAIIFFLLKSVKAKHSFDLIKQIFDLFCPIFQ